MSDFWVRVQGLALGGTVGFLFTFVAFDSADLKTQGAISAHKGEIVCFQLAFKEERWECGEL